MVKSIEIKVAKICLNLLKCGKIKAAKIKTVESAKTVFYQLLAISTTQEKKFKNLTEMLLTGFSGFYQFSAGFSDFYRLFDTFFYHSPHFTTFYQISKVLAIFTAQEKKKVKL